MNAKQQTTIRDMEEELEKIMRTQQEEEEVKKRKAEETRGMSQTIEADNRSVYVGNVDYGAEEADLKIFFQTCGEIKRVTIPRNKWDGSPKGYAYVEFSNKESVSGSLTLNGSILKGRKVKITPKRTNRPGITSTERLPKYFNAPVLKYVKRGPTPRFRNKVYVAPEYLRKNKKLRLASPE